MALIELDGISAETLNSGGTAGPGKAHMKVLALEDCGDYTKAVFEVIAHEDASQVGRKSYNLFNHSGNGAKRSVLFTIACGVVDLDDLVAAQKEGRDTSIDIEDAVGRSFCGKLVKSNYNDKDRVQVEWDFRRPGTPEAAEYPQADADDQESVDSADDDELAF